jgi:hypothetical protein
LRVWGPARAAFLGAGAGAGGIFGRLGLARAAFLATGALARADVKI